MRSVFTIIICAALCTYLCKQKISELKDYDGGIALKNGKCRCFKDEDPKEEPPIPIYQGIKKMDKSKDSEYQFDDRPIFDYASE